MCKTGAQCGCGGGQGGLPALAVAGALAVAADGVSMVLADVVTVALVTVIVLAVAGTAWFVHLVRASNAEMRGAERRAALPPVPSPRLAAGSQRAVSTARRDAAITSLTITHPEGLRK
jgi:hypothetical protein